MVEYHLCNQHLRGETTVSKALVVHTQDNVVNRLGQTLTRVWCYISDGENSENIVENDCVETYVSKEIFHLSRVSISRENLLQIWFLEEAREQLNAYTHLYRQCTHWSCYVHCNLKPKAFNYEYYSHARTQFRYKQGTVYYCSYVRTRLVRYLRATGDMLASSALAIRTCMSTHMWAVLYV